MMRRFLACLGALVFAVTMAFAAVDRSIPTSGPLSPTGFAQAINEELAELYKLAPALVGSVSGTNTITGTITPSISAYATTPLVIFQAANTNSGAVTVNWNSVGAADLLKQGGSALASGDIVSGAFYMAAWSQSAGDWFLVGSVGAGGSFNTLLSGSGAPSGGTGVDGDFYVDTATLDIYGPKTSGSWGSAVSIVGPAGPTGNPGLIWRGAWETSTVYAVNDAVAHGGSSYIATAAHTSGSSTEPGVGVDWTANWNVLASSGSQGLAGTSALRWNFDSSTTTAADPGTGDFRLNNASFASVTEASISDDSGESGNPDVEAWLLTFDNSTSTVKGYLTFKKAAAQENFATYSIGAVSDESGYVKVTLTHIASSGSFSDTDPVAIEFTPNGNKGDAGASGDGSGDMLAANNLSDLDDIPTARENLGLEVGADVQAYNSFLACLAGLGDAGADAITFWDDSLGACNYLTPSSPLSIAGTNLSVAAASESAQGVIEKATTGEAETGTDTDRAVTPAGVRAAITGKQTIGIPAGAIRSRGSGGPDCSTAFTGTNVETPVCRFDAGTDEHAQFMLPMPKGADESAGIDAQVIWTSASASGNVIWAVRCAAVGNDDALDAAMGTAQSVTDGITAANDQMISGFTSSITPSGTWAEGDVLYCDVSRDADNGSDTASGDALLLGLRLRYTTTNSVDD